MDTVTAVWQPRKDSFYNAGGTSMIYYPQATWQENRIRRTVEKQKVIGLQCTPEVAVLQQVLPFEMISKHIHNAEYEVKQKPLVDRLRQPASARSGLVVAGSVQGDLPYIPADQQAPPYGATGGVKNVVYGNTAYWNSEQPTETLATQSTPKPNMTLVPKTKTKTKTTISSGHLDFARSGHTVFAMSDEHAEQYWKWFSMANQAEKEEYDSIVQGGDRRGVVEKTYKRVKEHEEL